MKTTPNSINMVEPLASAPQPSQGGTYTRDEATGALTRNGGTVAPPKGSAELDERTTRPMPLPILPAA